METLTYTVSKPLRRGPLGLFFIGPVSSDTRFEPEGSWWKSWHYACGVEVTVLGRALAVFF